MEEILRKGGSELEKNARFGLIVSVQELKNDGSFLLRVKCGRVSVDFIWSRNERMDVQLDRVFDGN